MLAPNTCHLFHPIQLVPFVVQVAVSGAVRGRHWDGQHCSFSPRKFCLMALNAISGQCFMVRFEVYLCNRKNASLRLLGGIGVFCMIA